MPITPPLDNKQEKFIWASATDQQYLTEGDVRNRVLSLLYLFKYYEIMEEMGKDSVFSR